MMVVAFAAAAAAAAAVGAAPASPLSSLGTCGAVTSELEQGPANCVVEKNSQWVRLLPPPSNSSSQNAPSPKPNGSATEPRPRRRLQSAPSPHGSADDPTGVVRVALGVDSVLDCCGLCEGDATLSADFGCHFSYCEAAPAGLWGRGGGRACRPTRCWRCAATVS